MNKTNKIQTAIVVGLITFALLATSCASSQYHTRPAKFNSNSCGYYFNHKH